MKGKAAARAQTLTIKINSSCIPGTGFQYLIRRKLAGESDYTIVMPEADRLSALSVPGIPPELNKALQQIVGVQG